MDPWHHDPVRPDWEPVPEERGERIPPGGPPPTAVGVMTPEPEPEEYGRKPSRMRRVAVGMIQTAFMTGGVVLVWHGGWVGLLGLAVTLGSVRQLVRAVYGADPIGVLRTRAMRRRLRRRPNGGEGRRGRRVA